MPVMATFFSVRRGRDPFFKFFMQTLFPRQVKDYEEKYGIKFIGWFNVAHGWDFDNVILLELPDYSTIDKLEGDPRSRAIGHRAGEWMFERHHAMFLRERRNHLPVAFAPFTVGRAANRLVARCDAFHRLDQDALEAWIDRQIGEVDHARFVDPHVDVAPRCRGAQQRGSAERADGAVTLAARQTWFSGEAHRIACVFRPEFGFRGGALESGAARSACKIRRGFTAPAA